MESKAAEISHEMLALGVVIASFEEQFARCGGEAGADFHRDWEAAIASWWRHAETFGELAQDQVPDGARVSHAASLSRMFRFE